MQEPIRIDVPQLNGHGHHRGSSVSSLDPPSAGFTAVNGFRPRSIGFRPEDTATSPYTVSEKESVHRPASGISQYHAHSWRPAESHSPQALHEPSERDSPITGKRKRNDVERVDHIPIETQNGDRNDLVKRSSTTLDSAVDLTSPENPSEPPPVEATDSDSSEQAGTYERQTTPTERWNQGDPPPKPRPETAAVLAASLHQFQQQNPEFPNTHQVQARSLTPYTHDTSPPNESDHMGEPHGYSDDQYHVDGSDPKRRKRNFSNRTKTGCHTCRKRKKKCDEGKPTCQNCERSGHPCEGYGPKPPGDGKPLSQNRSVMPLQSKTPMASYNGRNSEPSGRAEEGRSYSHWGRVPPPPPPPEPEARPFLPVTQVPPADLRRPNTADNWQKSAFHPQEPPPAYHHERLPPPSNFSHQPPPQIVYGPPPQQHPPPQQFTAQPHYQAPPPQHQPSHAHQPQHQPPPPQPQPRQTGPPPPPHIPLEPWGHQPGPSPYPMPNGVSPPSMVSSRESVHSGSQRSGTFGMEYGGHRLIEKDKMLRGQPFLHYLDRALIEDREACKAAVERYNKAAEMNSCLSAGERGRLFTQVLKPSKRPNPKARDTQHNVPVGSIGDHTVVETPFKCEYGYNIHIGKECIIESEAYFQDAADIGIGNRVTIGPNVKLYCITANIDPSARKGSHSTVVAGAIAIQDESFIGADSIVMPFVTVGRGAVVGAGSVVTKDVEPLTVVAGNPAKLIRRIEGSNVGRHHSQQIQRQQENMQQWMKEYANSGFSTYTSPRIG